MAKWPSLKTYDQDHLKMIALPLGGIGTGTVSLGGRGNLFDWEIHNRPGKNKSGAENFLLSDYGGNAFFTLYTKQAGQEPVMRVLEGELQPPYEASHGSWEAFHGLPRFRRASFETAEAFNPLIPADADRSGMPVAVMRYVLKNRTDQRVSATLCGTLQNLCAGETRENKPFTRGKVKGIAYSGTGGNRLDPAAGTMALSVLEGGVSTRPEWEKGRWRTPILHFWDDLLDDGKLEKVRGERDMNALFGSLASSVTVPPKGEVAVTFLITWHFPNRYNWQPEKGTNCCGEGSSCLNPADRIGNYYTGQYRDAIDVAVKTAKALPVLERDTVAFVDAFCGSDLPDAVKESALFNVSTLRSETCFRTPDGLLYGWEGCCDGGGCCEGSCTHVWNYETTTPFLFGDLARGMRRVEFAHATNESTGRMSFRVKLPLTREKGEGPAAADGQMGCIMKMYREWQLSGDRSFLQELWPRVRKSLEFCWIPGGWDADRDGVMEGCQHNTMDVEYYGPNPQMGTWYLGALRAAEEMARAVGEDDFAVECRRLVESGSAYMDEHLFNGEYY
ncbi:MAG: GH116 family glycosyl-hydrolase, partial [Planctomycetota bacterium]